MRLAWRLQWSFILGAAILGVLALGEATATYQKPLLLVGALAVGVAWSYVAPGRLTYVVRLAAGPQLRKHSISYNLLTTIGFGVAPLLLGLARAAGGFPGGFAAAAAMVVLAQLLFLGLPTALDVATPGQRESWLAELKRLPADLAKAPDIRRVLVVCAIVHVMLGPVQVLVQPLLAEQFQVGIVGRGAFLALLAPVLIVGGIMAMAIPAARHPERPLLLATIIAFVGLLGTLAGTMAWTVVAFLVFGIAGGFGVASIAALLQARAAAEQRGKIMGLYAISTQFFPALGGLISGIALALAGVEHAMWIVVGLTFVCYAPFMPAMWRMREK